MKRNKWLLGLSLLLIIGTSKVLAQSDSEGFTVSVLTNASYESEGTTAADCEGDGSVLLTANGSGGPFTAVVVGGGGQTYELGPGREWLLSGLCRGDYNVQFISDGGCTYEQRFEISSCTELVVNEINFAAGLTPPSSCDAADGSIYWRYSPIFDNLSGEASWELYDIFNNPLSISEFGTYLDLVAGNYFLSIEDRGCTYRHDFTLGSEAILALYFDQQQPCEGMANGELELYVDTDADFYAVEWEDGSEEEIRTGLAAGTYCVTVTSSAGCEEEDCFELENVSAELSLTASAEYCAYSSTLGSIDLTVSVSDVEGGANPSLSYLWDDGAITPDRSNLLEGEYCVTVTMENNCETSVSGCFLVGEENNPGNFCCLEIAVDDFGPIIGEWPQRGFVNYSSNATLDDLMNVEVFRRISTNPDDFILYESYSPTGGIEGLHYGTYFIRITDGNGCSVDSGNFTIIGCPSQEYLDNAVVYAIDHIEDYGDVGILVVEHEVVEGFENFTYRWQSGFGTPQVFETNVPMLTTSIAGDYRVDITDECGNTKVVYTGGEINSIEGVVQHCDFKPDVHITNRCMERGLFTPRPKFDFPGNLFGKYLLAEVGDVVNVTITYSPDEGEAVVLFPFNDQLEIPTIDAIDFNGGFNWYYDWTYNLINGGSYHELHNRGPGVITLHVDFASGCSGTWEYGFGSRSIPTAIVWDPMNIQSSELLIYEDPTVFSPVIVGMERCVTCLSRSEFEELSSKIVTDCYADANPSLKYRPTDRSNPCRSGGILEVENDLTGDRFITIPPTLSARTFQNGNSCGCIFPYGSVLYNEFLQLLPFAGNYENRDVYVEFPCVDEPGEEPPAIEPADYCSDYCEPGEDCFAAQSESNPCTRSLYCQTSTGDYYVGVEDIFAAGNEDFDPSDICYIPFPSDSVIMVGIPCAANQCDLYGFTTNVPGGGIFLYPDDMEQIREMYTQCIGGNNCRYDLADFPKVQDRVALLKETDTRFSNRRIEGAVSGPSLSLFPNPNRLNSDPIHLDCSESMSLIQVFRLSSGSLLFSQELQNSLYSSEIGMSHFKSSGVYLLRVTTISGEVINRRVIVND